MKSLLYLKCQAAEKKLDLKDFGSVGHAWTVISWSCWYCYQVSSAADCELKALHAFIWFAELLPLQLAVSQGGFEKTFDLSVKVCVEQH